MIGWRIDRDGRRVRDYRGAVIRAVGVLLVFVGLLGCVQWLRVH